MTSPAPHSYDYMPILKVPAYVNYEFEFNWLFAVLLVNLAYTIPGIFVFLKIAFFYILNKGKIQKSGLRVEIFQAFLLMQLFGNLQIIGEFLLFRIPLSTLITSYCASENPQFLLKFISYFYYTTFYSALFLTVLFCGLRVAILYSVEAWKTGKAILICPFLIVIAGLIVAHPHIFTPGMCMQMFGNFPFGSVVVISVFSYFHSSTMEILDMCFISSACLAILILNFLMLKKLRQRNKIAALKSSSQNTSIERTLTGSMIILLIPLLVHFLIAATILFDLFDYAPSFVSHFMMIRPFVLDLRVHSVTLYFYFTHPVFKDRTISTTASSNMRS